MRGDLHVPQQYCRQVLLFLPFEKRNKKIRWVKSLPCVWENRDWNQGYWIQNLHVWFLSWFFFYSLYEIFPQTQNHQCWEGGGFRSWSCFLDYQVQVAAWMPTPAVTVLLCECRDHGRRSLKTYPTWYVSCSSSSTSPHASSLPASSSTEIRFLKASFPGRAHNKSRKPSSIEAEGLMVAERVLLPF